MKRRATAILLGIMVSSMFLSACEKNDAKEAANESAQVEEEGVGEVTEEGEKVEAENKTSDTDSTGKSGDSEGTKDENTDADKESGNDAEKDTDKDTDKDGEDSDSTEDEMTEAPAGKIGVLLSEDDDNAKIDSEAMTSQIADGGYEADVKNADGDSALQISQIQEFIDEQVSALVIEPVDPYGLTDILKTAKEQGIPVISYEIGRAHV